MTAKSSPRFSVIIPAYNYGKYVSRAIDSALAQQGEHQPQVIVVDDGSKDDTPQVTAQYGDRIISLRQINQGVSVARNRGIQEAQAEWLVFLDADDRLLPTALDRFQASIAGDSQARIHFGHYFSTDADGSSRESKPRPPMHVPLENFRRFIQRQFTISTGTACYHRDVFERIRFPVGMTNGQDVVVDALALACFPARTIPHPLAEIFAHPGRNRDNVERLVRCGTSTVDAVFNPDILPPDAMRLKPMFLARWNLTLARACYRAGDYRRARDYYRQAAANRWTSLLHLTHGVRFLKSVLRAA